MKVLLLLISVVFIMSDSKPIHDFTEKSSLDGWRIVDDGVMGGRSQGDFHIDEDGHGHFSGTISLENNGGFSSLRYRFKEIDVSNYSKIVLTVKGDGKDYQFRVKHNRRSYHSYINYFETDGTWQEIEIPIKSMYPSFRGFRLRRPNFNHDSIEELAFLFGNKKQEGFDLLIDKIELR